MDLVNGDKTISKVIVEPDKCIGVGTCVVMASQAFQLNTQGIAEVLPTALTLTDKQLIDAAKSCPTQAIKLLDANGIEIKL